MILLTYYYWLTIIHTYIMSRIARKVNLSEVSDQELRYYKGPLKAL